MFKRILYVSFVSGNSENRLSSKRRRKNSK